MLKDLPDAVLWDMDGTLIDQTASILRCYGEVLSQMGYAVPNDYTIKRSLGGPLASTLAELLPIEQVDAGSELFRKLFPQYMFEGMKVLEGAIELIEKLDSKNVQQAIITNKQGDNARKVSAKCGFNKIIKICVGNGDNAFKKPEYAFTESVVNQLQAPLKSIVLIGDSPTDVQTALNYGIQVIGVSTGAHSVEELMASGADIAFPSLLDVINHWSL